MLDTAPVLWLQAWASPALTAVMQLVSALGYAPSCLAMALACAFGWRFRLGLTLVLAVVFADAITIVAKGAFASPRPHAVDARVRAPAAWPSDARGVTSNSRVPADDFGFPSGHVATTAAWALGAAWSASRRRSIAMATAWIALMATSRMYLGRHFPVDVAGGVLVGIAGFALGAGMVTVPGAARGWTRPVRTAAITGVALLLGLVAVAALGGAGLSAHDAGRFCGLTGAALLLVRRWPALDAPGRPVLQLSRTVAGLVLLGVAVWSSTWPLTAGADRALVSLGTSGVLHAGALLVPALMHARPGH